MSRWNVSPCSLVTRPGYFRLLHSTHHHGSRRGLVRGILGKAVAFFIQTIHIGNSVDLPVLKINTAPLDFSLLLHEDFLEFALSLEDDLKRKCSRS